MLKRNTREEKDEGKEDKYTKQLRIDNDGLVSVKEELAKKIAVEEVKKENAREEIRKKWDGKREKERLKETKVQLKEQEWAAVEEQDKNKDKAEAT